MVLGSSNLVCWVGNSLAIAAACQRPERDVIAEVKLGGV